MIRPVQAVVHSERHSASDRDVWQVVKQSSGTGVRCHCRASRADQVGDLTPVERQVHNALQLDHLPDADVLCFHHGRVRLNLDLLRHLPYFQHRIDHWTAVDLQHNSRLNKRAKSRQSRFQLVRTKRKVWEHVNSGFIRHCISRHARVGLRCNNLDARQNRATLISHAATDLSRRLRPDRGRIQRKNKERNAQSNQDCFHRSSH